MSAFPGFSPAGLPWQKSLSAPGAFDGRFGPPAAYLPAPPVGAAGDERRRAEPCPPLLRSRAAVPRVLPAGLRVPPAHGPGRAALRPGLQADAGDGGFRRHPVPGRGPAQEARGHLLDAERRRRHRRGAGRPGGARRHRPLPPALPVRGRRDGSPDLLGGARLLRPARGLPGGRPHGRLGHSHGGGEARQDRTPCWPPARWR
jgi:hypothetical protein